jgi:clan AA aspartic protease
MGLVHTEITIKNAGDIIVSNRGYIQEKDVRAITVTALVDTGAITLVINEKVRKALGLRIKSSRSARLADGSKQLCDRTEPVEIQWKDRDTSCEAIVLPDGPNILLGAIPMEDMDLIVDPGMQEVVGAHGDEPLSLVYSAGVSVK